MTPVEFVADKKSGRFCDPQAPPHRIVASNAGLLVRALPYAEINSLSPPLCITRNYVDEVVERYGRDLHRAMPELRQIAG